MLWVPDWLIPATVLAAVTSMFLLAAMVSTQKMSMIGDRLTVTYIVPVWLVNSAILIPTLVLAPLAALVAISVGLSFVFEGTIEAGAKALEWITVKVIETVKAVKTAFKEIPQVIFVHETE